MFSSSTSAKVNHSVLHVSPPLPFIPDPASRGFSPPPTSIGHPPLLFPLIPTIPTRMHFEGF